MNKDEMINNIATGIGLACTSIELDLKDRQEIAKTLYILGCRKVADGEIVLDKEEWETLHNDYAKALYNARKQTAKEIFENIEFYGVRSLNDKIWGNHFILTDTVMLELKMKHGIAKEKVNELE